MNDTHGRRVMVIMAHPDDPDFFCGGTVARWAREGAALYYVIITNGSKGSDDPRVQPDQLAQLRMAEQRAAGEVLGVRAIEFLGYVDGELVPFDPTLRCELTRLIREIRPEVVICPDPDTRITVFGSVNHSDHRIAGEIALDAIYPAARNPHYCPDLLTVDGLEPYAVREIYLAGSLQPNTTVDITETIEHKIQAISQHASQLKNVEEMAERVRTRLKVEEDGHVVYREAFRRIQLPS